MSIKCITYYTHIWVNIQECNKTVARIGLRSTRLIRYRMEGGMGSFIVNNTHNQKIISFPLTCNLKRRILLTGRPVNYLTK